VNRRIRHVDAFTATPLEGNPAAVVDGEGLSGELMQRIALNQHLAETVFLLPPEDAANHAHIRIFTPTVELPFAGHPTIAAAHTLISEHTVALRDGATLRLETGVGVIPVDTTTDAQSAIYTMTQASPEFRDSDVPPLDEIAALFGLRGDELLRAEHVSTGIWWLVAQVSSLEAMLRVRPDFPALATHDISIFCVGAESPGADIHVRTFGAPRGVPEDPVTGSANGCIAAFVAKHALLPHESGHIRYVAEQGIEIGQPGLVYLHASGMPEAISVQVGGRAVTALVGDLLLPD
jgi:PhzF family phenazine biosynthesis protein